MAHVASSTSEPGNERSVTLQRMPDVQKSDAHISQLLAIGNHSLQLLVTPDNFDQRVQVDAESQKEAAATFALVHTRLRDLVDEQARWGLQKTEPEEEASELIAKTLKLYDEKIENTRIHNRPSLFLRPKIARFEVGWIVWVGGDVPLRQDLHGVGRTPELAAKEFDKCYFTQKKIADAQPPAVVLPAQPQPAPRRKSVKKKI